MINVQPYLDELSLLQEWLFLLIDQQQSFLFLDINAVPVVSPKEILRLFYETGVLLGNSAPMSSPRFITFKEYKEFKKIKLN